jgi:RNA polymerase sigma-70 factor (ECF subfamily)
MPERTDSDCLARLAARDGAAVAELRDRLCRGLVTVLAGRADPSAAEDFAQEATLRVLDRLADFRGGSRFFTWAMAVATRVAFSELRKARYKDVSLDALAAAGGPVPEPAAADDPAAALDRAGVVETLRRLIDTTLTDRQRAVIRAELDGVPQAVIADRLGTNRNALYKLGHDARMKLRAGLEAAGISAGEVRALPAGASNG